jgi:hypothetical protein
LAAIAADKRQSTVRADSANTLARCLGVTPKIIYDLTKEGIILKRAPLGDNQNDYDVLENGVVVGRVFVTPAAPQDRQWMWASGHNGEIRHARHGYEATRDAAMAALAKSWRRE